MSNPVSAPSAVPVAPPVPDRMPNRVPLRQRVIAAGAWSLVGYAVSQVIRFGSNLVMTRLLVPEMFGVMAIATIVMVGLGMFSDLGLRQSIVQSRRGDDPAFLNTAWALQILRGLVLWGMALMVALGLYLAGRAGLVPAASVYADPSLPWVVAALSFGTVIAGLGSTKTFQASRNLALGRVTQIQLSAQVAGLAVMLAWTWLDRSVWALVAAGLATSAVSAVASHRLLPGTPNRWQWDPAALKELVHFGKWIFLGSVLGFVVANCDRLLLGALVDATTFGVCVIAFLIVSAVEQVVARLSSGVALSALSEIVRTKHGALHAAYYRLHAPIAAVSYFSVGFLVVSGQALVTLLYDHRFAEAGWMLKIIAVGLLTAPVHIATQCYLALGLPQLHSVVIVIRLIGILILIPIGFCALGLEGALWGIVLSQLAYIPAVVLFNKRHGLLDGSREVLLLPMILIGAAVAGAFALMLGYWR